MIAFSFQHSTLEIKISVVERSTRTKHYSRSSADACRQCARAIQSGVSKSTRMPGWKKIFYIRFIKSLSRVTFSHRNWTDDSMEEIRPSLDHFQEPFAGNVQPRLLHKQLKVPDCVAKAFWCSSWCPILFSRLFWWKRNRLRVERSLQRTTMLRHRWLALWTTRLTIAYHHTSSHKRVLNGNIIDSVSNEARRQLLDVPSQSFAEELKQIVERYRESLELYTHLRNKLRIAHGAPASTEGPICLSMT